MAAPKRVLCMMDLALVGRSSLAVVLPVLAACGVQGCALPGALFSSHTGGFAGVQKRDEAGFCGQALAQYAAEQVDFDAVYVGYLCSPGQFDVARAAFKQYPNALHVVDPALGDGGKPYSGIGEETIAAMGALCGEADLITPNATEAALLAGITGNGGAEDPAKALATARRSVVVTSVEAPGADGAGSPAYRTNGWDARKNEGFSLPSRRVPQGYPGTGDLFCAALVGLVTSGRAKDLQDACRQATDFVETAVEATWRAGAEPRHGVWFEPHLNMLACPAPTGGVL